MLCCNCFHALKLKQQNVAKQVRCFLFHRAFWERSDGFHWAANRHVHFAEKSGHTLCKCWLHGLMLRRYLGNEFNTTSPSPRPYGEKVGMRGGGIH